MPGELTAGQINILIKATDHASRVMGGIGGAAGNMGQAIRRASMIGAAGMAAAGVAAVRFASDFDSAYNTIRRGTGATGEALEALKEDFRETFRDVPDSMADVATATADINTRLGLTGPPLQAMTRQFLDFARVAEIDVATAVAAGTRAFGDWSIATENQTEALDHAWRVAQTTGIGVDSLMQKVVQFGAPLRQFGYGFEEATVLLGAWEREGVNAEAILGALKIGVANFARENIDAVTGLQDFIAELTELGPGAEATARAIEIFGSRAGPDMAAAVTEGRFALDELMAIIEASPETIAAAAEETLTWQDKLRTLRNEMLVRVEPALAAMTEKAEEFSEWLAEEGAPAAEEFIRSLRPLLPVLEGLWHSFLTGLETIRPPVEWLFRFIVDNKPILVAAIVAIGLAIVVAFGPVSIAIAAILGLILAIGWVRDNWEMLRAETERILGIIGAVVDEKMGYIDEVIVWYVTHYVNVWRETLAAIVGFIRENWETIEGIFGDSFGIISTIVTANLGQIANIFQFGMAVIRGDWRTAWDELVQIARNRWDLIRELSELSFSLLRGIFTLQLAVLRDVFVFAFTAYISMWRELGENVVRALWAGIESMKDWLLSKLGDLVGSIKDKLDPRNWRFNPIGLTVHYAEQGLEAGRELVEGITSGVGGGIGAVRAALGDIVGDIGRTLSQPTLESTQAALQRARLELERLGFADATGGKSLSEILEAKAAVVGMELDPAVRRARLAGLEAQEAAARRVRAIDEELETLRSSEEVRRLELEIMEAQALLASETLLTDQELLAQYKEQLTLMASVNDLLADLASGAIDPVTAAFHALELGLFDLAETLLNIHAGLGALPPPVPGPPALPPPGGGWGEAPGFQVPAGLPAGIPAQNVTINVTVEDRSPAAIAHAVEMAGLELGQQLAAEV